MKTQFFYLRREIIANGAPTRANAEPIYAYRRCSFNLAHVVRSVELRDGSVMILLITPTPRVKEFSDIALDESKIEELYIKNKSLQLEIHLSKEDGERFHRITAIEDGSAKSN